MVKRTHGRPSLRWGWRRAVQLWRLVGATWLVWMLAFAPALLVLRTTVSSALAAVPPGRGSAPEGDIPLIVVDAARQILAPMGLAVASGFVVLWIWTVLWHAGVVSWQLWTGGRRVRLGEVLGLGLVAWWRYARLSLTAFGVLALAGVAWWLPISTAIQSSYEDMNEVRALTLVAVGLVGTKLVVSLVWIVTIHGAWLLGLPEHRSAFLTWFRGAWSALRTPLSSLLTWLAWLIPAWLAAVAPLVLGIRFGELRGTVALTIFGVLAGLVRAFCWVGLFSSFAPITGLVSVAEKDEE